MKPDLYNQLSLNTVEKFLIFVKGHPILNYVLGVPSRRIYGNYEIGFFDWRGLGVWRSRRLA